ncbi:MAG: hypothetical protein ABIX28_23540 [Vicinamibacterales bacterium]
MTSLNRAVMAIAVTTLLTGTSAAQQWSDRTTLTFDAPMQVPGATLPPGTYVFTLLNSSANRHMVQIFNDDQTKLIASTQAIPTKRMEPSGDVVLRLNPTETGTVAPAAIKAWFYPGSLYGHQFVYSDDEARDIAQRTKTLVLSGETADSNMGSGSLHTYDAQGQKTAWRDDPQVATDFAMWSQQGRATAKVAAPGTQGTRQSTAPMMRSAPKGMEVAVGDLEENPNQYIGQTVTVTAEVEDVFGPHLFKIDEPNWGDLDGEILVHLPSNLAALVRENDRVTVTGTMRMLIAADIERELGWLDPTPETQVTFAKRPVLEAVRVVGGDSDVAIAINVDPKPSASEAVGTSGVSTNAGKSDGDTSALTDVDAVGRGGSALVGRPVRLNNAKVVNVSAKSGFWVQGNGTNVFVLPAAHAQAKAPAVGQSVSLDGFVMEMPRSLREKTRAGQSGNEAIYVYATTVK